MVTIDKIFHASVVLKDIIRPTPLAKAYGIAEDCKLYLKPECLQKTGACKLRGSGYKIAMLSDEERPGVLSPAPPETTLRAWPGPPANAAFPP